MKIFFDCANLWFLFLRENKIMCCKSFWRTITPFILAFLLGIMFAGISQNILLKANYEKIDKSDTLTFTQSNEGGGCGECSLKKSEEVKCLACKDGILPAIKPDTKENLKKETLNLSELTKSVTILSKPRAYYSDLAKQNNVQGNVTLRVTFIADGTIGTISVVNGLPDGLTEQAIVTAHKIKFEPAIKNGHPISVTKQIVYTFTIY